MAYTNPIVDLWRADRPAFGFWAGFPNAFAIEYAASTDVDWILVDTQHDLIAYGAMAAMLLACRTGGKPGVVRVAENDFTLIGRALDAGALGVVIPLVNTAEEAAAAVAACRYPPHGGRSFGPNRTTLVIGSMDRADLTSVACIPMVETSDGLANVDAIAATPGVDAILIGPSDLAIALGLEPSDRGPTHAEAVAHILAACQRHGKAAGYVSGDGATARQLAEQGFRFLPVATDSGLIVGGLRRESALARGE